MEAAYTTAFSSTGNLPMQALRYVHDAARNVLGERVYRKLVSSVLSNGFVRKIALAEHTARDVGPSKYELLRLYEQEVATTLSLGVQYCYGTFIEGDIVEFGTASGFSARVIARAMVAAERNREGKRLHLFDSFVGLPEATSEVDKNSFEVREGIWNPGTCRLLSKDELFQSCARIIPADRIAMHEGWFSDTVARLPSDQRFAFIHFDGDLYQSTIDAIGGLLQRGAISKGAVICFDDWNCGQADPNFGERKAWRDLTDKYRIEFSDWRAYGTMGKAFFIHDYQKA
jgi:O-methyltransferase